jgi:hypothetical protein
MPLSLHPGQSRRSAPARLAWLRLTEVWCAGIANRTVRRDLAQFIVGFAATHARFLRLTFAANRQRFVLRKPGKIAALRAHPAFEAPCIACRAVTNTFVDAMYLIHLATAFVAVLPPRANCLAHVHIFRCNRVQAAMTARFDRGRAFLFVAAFLGPRLPSGRSRMIFSTGEGSALRML